MPTSSKAAQGAVRACFSNAGQLCISIERIYVHEPFCDEFVAEFVTPPKHMKLGTGWTTPPTWAR